MFASRDMYGATIRATMTTHCLSDNSAGPPQLWQGGKQCIVSSQALWWEQFVSHDSQSRPLQQMFILHTEGSAYSSVHAVDLFQLVVD